MTLIVESIESNFWRTYLGNSTPKIRYAVTLNISPKQEVKMKTKGRMFNTLWGVLRPIEQREYLIEYIRNVYKPISDACHFRFELCKSGELHAHGLLIIEDKLERNEYWLSDIRKQVIQNPLVQRLTKRVIRKIITMNHIVFNDKPEEWEEYLIKDIDKHPLPPIYFTPRVD